MKHNGLLAGVLFGILLLIATPLQTWLYCSHSSSSDFVLDGMISLFSFVISCLLAFVVYHLLKIRRCALRVESAELLEACCRCATFCTVSMILILSFLGVSLAWTAFIVAMLYYPDLSGLPFDGWRLLFYITIAADLLFNLFVKRALRGISGK